MFTDVGFAEMAVIGVMALIVLGPERLPGAARAAGKWVAKVRRMVSDMQRDIKAELDANELDSLKDIGKGLKEAGETFKSQASSVDQQLKAGLKKDSSAMDDAIADTLGKETKKASAANTTPPKAEGAAEGTAKKTTNKVSKKKVAKKSAANSTASKVATTTNKKATKKTTKKTTAKKPVAKKPTANKPAAKAATKA